MRPLRGTLKHVVFERCDLREATFSAAACNGRAPTCELHGIRGAEALRGARMPWNDVLQNAVLFASLAGIEIVTTTSER